jgi:hypothetical protein
VLVLNLDHPFQDNLGFRKLGLLPIFGPSGGAYDSCDTHRVILCGDAAGIFLDEFGLGSGRRNDAGLCDQSRHRTISFLGMLKNPFNCVLDALPSSRTYQYAPGVQSSAALLESFFEHSL